MVRAAVAVLPPLQSSGNREEIVADTVRYSEMTSHLKNLNLTHRPVPALSCSWTFQPKNGFSVVNRQEKRLQVILYFPLLLAPCEMQQDILAFACFFR